MNKPDKPLYTMREVTDIFGVHRNTIMKWVQQGKLRRIQINPRYIRYVGEDVERLASKGHVTAEA